MQLLKVGKAYFQDGTRLPHPGYQYNYDTSGHILLLNVPHPSQRKVDAVQDGQDTHFWLVVNGDVIFLCWDFDSVWWGECPYNWNMVSPECRRLSDTGFPSNEGTMLEIHLVDADTGIIRALRLLALSHAFSTELHTAIRAQSLSEFNQADYDKQLARLYAAYTSKQLRQRAIAHCRAGEKDRPALFELGRTVMTVDAEEALQRNNIHPFLFLRRHQSGDFGVLGDYYQTTLTEDEAARGPLATSNGDKLNRFGIDAGNGHIVSAYLLPDDTRIGCITKADRSITTLFLAEE